MFRTLKLRLIIKDWAQHHLFLTDISARIHLLAKVNYIFNLVPNGRKKQREKDPALSQCLAIYNRGIKGQGNEILTSLNRDTAQEVSTIQAPPGLFHYGPLSPFFHMRYLMTHCTKNPIYVFPGIKLCGLVFPVPTFMYL